MPGLTGLHLIGFRRDRREAVFLFLAYHWPQAGYGVSGKSSAIHIALNLDLTSVLENTGVCPLVAQCLSSAEQEWVEQRSGIMLMADRMKAYR